MAKINLRSPYHIYYTFAGMTRAVLDLYIYTGTKVATIPSVTYSLDSAAYNNAVTFEISDLIKDYLDITFNGNYTSQVVYCNYRITRYVGESDTQLSVVQLECFDGYGYFQEGVNPQNNTGLLQSNSIIYVPKTETVIVPVNQNNIVDVKFYLLGSLQSTSTISPKVESTSSEIRYTSRANVDRVDVYNGTTTTTITVENVEECKYTPYKITFINKFGALQDLWFFKRTNKTLTTSKESYKSNILVNGSYDISSHQNRLLNKQGKEQLVLNSGFVDEEMNEVFTQLNLSEKVWILIEGQTLPINISDSSFSYKTQLDDKLINYTINVEFAFDKINNVR